MLKSKQPASIRQICRYSGLTLNTTDRIFPTQKPLSFGIHPTFSLNWLGIQKIQQDLPAAPTAEQLSILLLASWLHPQTLGTKINLHAPAIFPLKRLEQVAPSLIRIASNVAALKPAQRDKLLATLPGFSSRAHCCFQVTQDPDLWAETLLTLGSALLDYLLDCTYLIAEWKLSLATAEIEDTKHYLSHEIAKRKQKRKHSMLPYSQCLTMAQDFFSLSTDEVQEIEYQLRKQTNPYPLHKFKSYLSGLKSKAELEQLPELVSRLNLTLLELTVILSGFTRSAAQFEQDIAGMLASVSIPLDDDDEDDLIPASRLVQSVSLVGLPASSLAQTSTPAEAELSLSVLSPALQAAIAKTKERKEAKDKALADSIATKLAALSPSVVAAINPTTSKTN